MWLAHAPFGLWPLGIVAVGLLWVSVVGQRVAIGASLGFVWGITFFFLLFDWAQLAAGILLARVGLSVAQALFVALVGAVWAWLAGLFVTPRIRKRQTSKGKGRRRSSTSYVNPTWALCATLLAAPSVWIAIEQLRSAIPFGGLPWGLVGFAMTGSPLMGLAPIGSTQVVGFAAVAAGIALVVSMFTIPAETGRSIIGVGLALLIVFMPGLFPSGGKPDGRINVAIVQGGTLSDAELEASPTRSLAVTKKHLDATLTLSGQAVDVVLWPESASDHDIRVNADAQALVLEAANAIGAPIVLGTQAYGDETRVNDYLVFYPDGRIGETYTKQHPVPFGEYIPFRDTFRAITPVVDQVSTDMLPGDGPALIDVETERGALELAIPICFEVAYSSIVAEAVAGGGQLIVVPTNNATFGDSGEPYQQFEMTRFRAVEHGRTAIQVSTTGTSGIVDPNGVVRYETDLFVPDARVVSVPLYTELTLATTTEEYRTVVFYLLGVICISLCVYRQVTNRKARL